MKIKVPRTKKSQASEVDIKSMDKKAQLSINIGQSYLKQKQKLRLMEFMDYCDIEWHHQNDINLTPLLIYSRGPEYRWIEFDGEVISIGF